MSASKNLCYFSIFKNFEANEELFKKMFEHPDVRDRNIIVISIAGTKRKGKSLFQNYCLKFLYDRFASINPSIDGELTGFPWGRNVNHETQDVLIWNDLFLYTKETTGEKFAIVVLDTIRSSDDSTVQEEIIKFVTMLSSVQVINLHSEIDIDQLEFLKSALESVKSDDFMQKDLSLKFLQHLVFLVRDWSNLNEFEYGYEEGEKYLTKLLENHYKNDLKSTLELFQSSFEKISCVLLPHPGNAFVNNGKNCSEIDEDFKDEIAAAIAYVLRPENLVPKKIYNAELKGSSFFEYVQKQISSYRVEKVQYPSKTEIDTKLKDETDPSYGHPMQVLKLTDDNKVLIEDETLRMFFGHRDLKDRKIVALSIIGAYRKGKSFFLNYCLRYLYANYPSINCQNKSSLRSNNWMGEKSEPLNGFSWRSGSVRDTSGIVMWNDAFLHTDLNGEKIAIIVIDTQGLFESGTLPIDDSRIFALGTLISSILVLNLFDVVQENQLEYLQFSIETAKYAIGENQQFEEKPFQHLMFLIRDWGNHDDHLCGLEGGNDYLNYFLKSKSDKKEEFKSISEVICDSFEKINCFLLPHPGNTVAVGKSKNKRYDGNWGDMDEDFNEELQKLIEFLLSPENLIPRKVNQMSLNGPEFLQYIQKCFELFQSDQLPQVKTICDSTVDKNMNKLINSCFNHYKDVVNSKLKYIKNINELQHLHETAKIDGINLYRKSNKMGDSENEEKYRKILEDKMTTYMKEVTVKEERNFKIMEEEKRKLEMLYKQKEKDQIMKFENQIKPVAMDQRNASGSTSGRSAELKQRTNEFASTGLNQQQSQPKPSMQSSQMPSITQNQLDPFVNKDLNTLVNSCVNEYRKMMLANQSEITNEETFQIYHELNKSGALLKFEDLKNTENSRHVKQYKEILEKQIEQIFKDFKTQLEQSMSEEIEERNRLLEIEEEKRQKEKQMERDRKFAEDIARLEEMKREQKSNEKQKQKIEELTNKLEMERRARIEAENIIYITEEIARKKKRNYFKKIFIFFFGDDESPGFIHHHQYNYLNNPRQ